MANSTTEIIQALEKQTEKVKVTLELPVGLVEFFNDLQDTPMPTLEEYATEAVLMQFESLLNGLPDTIFNMPEIHKTYGLREFAHKKEALQQAST
jgi:hypothetical protein